MSQLIIYTDGAASGNPGPGGYGAVLLWGTTRKELSGGYRLTTNNRMELMAVIKALSALTREGLDILIYTDSKYVMDAVEKKWIWNWVKTGFKGKKNADLWTEFIQLYRKHKVSFRWVKGHAGNPLNERCDVLATSAYKNAELEIDHAYEHENKNIL
jgi:ribonuclease HI